MKTFWRCRVLNTGNLRFCVHSIPLRELEQLPQQLTGNRHKIGNGKCRLCCTPSLVSSYSLGTRSTSGQGFASAYIAMCANVRSFTTISKCYYFRSFFSSGRLGGEATHSKHSCLRPVFIRLPSRSDLLGLLLALTSWVFFLLWPPGSSSCLAAPVYFIKTWCKPF